MGDERILRADCEGRPLIAHVNGAIEIRLKPKSLVIEWSCPHCGSACKTALTEPELSEALSFGQGLRISRLGR